VKEGPGLFGVSSLFSGMIHSCDGVIIGKVPKTFYLRACDICVEFSHQVHEDLLTIRSDDNVCLRRMRMREVKAKKRLKKIPIAV
jgi:hypothetical protein